MKWVAPSFLEMSVSSKTTRTIPAWILPLLTRYPKIGSACCGPPPWSPPCSCPFSRQTEKQFSIRTSGPMISCKTSSTLGWSIRTLAGPPGTARCSGGKESGLWCICLICSTIASTSSRSRIAGRTRNPDKSNRNFSSSVMGFASPIMLSHWFLAIFLRAPSEQHQLVYQHRTSRHPSQGVRSLLLLDEPLHVPRHQTNRNNSTPVQPL